MKTRVHELLNVGEGEIFTITGYDDDFLLSVRGRLRVYNKDIDAWTPCSKFLYCDLLAKLLNGDERIIRRTTHTPEQYGCPFDEPIHNFNKEEPV